MDDDHSVLTDEDRQTPSNGHRSSDGMISEVVSVSARENEQLQQEVSASPHHSVDVDNSASLSKLNIKEDHEADATTDQKRRGFDEHVQVSRVTRASRHSLNTEMTFTESSACPRRKSTGNVLVSRASRRRAETITERPIDPEASRISFGTNPVLVDQTTQIDHEGLVAAQRQAARKSVVTRVSFSGLPFQTVEKDPHVTVEHIAVNRKPSS